MYISYTIVLHDGSHCDFVYVSPVIDSFASFERFVAMSCDVVQWGCVNFISIPFTMSLSSQ